MKAGFDFELGDVVKWTSQGRGVFLEKSGMIVQRLRAGEQVDAAYWKHLRVPDNRGAHREYEESYVIRVGRNFYWPVTKQLKIVRRARKKKER
jgi:hypothetical protein